MKRSIVILSFALALYSPFPQRPNPPQMARSSAKSSLFALISTAHTPAEHTRIAEYYQAQATAFLAESKEHEEMATADRNNPATNNSKFVAGTVNHCEYIAQSLKKDADQAQDLAKLHEEIGKGSDTKVKQVGTLPSGAALLLEMRVSKDPYSPAAMHAGPGELKQSQSSQTKA